ncbi:MAG: hypothetical protein ACXU95_13785, partial [Isosphaeraceae bacterium]
MRRHSGHAFPAILAAFSVVVFFAAFEVVILFIVFWLVGLIETFSKGWFDRHFNTWFERLGFAGHEK